MNNPSLHLGQRFAANVGAFHRSRFFFNGFPAKIVFVFSFSHHRNRVHCPAMNPRSISPSHCGHLYPAIRVCGMATSYDTLYLQISRLDLRVAGLQ